MNRLIIAQSTPESGVPRTRGDEPQLGDLTIQVVPLCGFGLQVRDAVCVECVIRIGTPERMGPMVDSEDPVFGLRRIRG